MHRLSYLLKYKCKLSSKKVDLLLGPIVDWTLHYKDYGVSKEAESMARDTAQTHRTSTYYLLILRMCCLWFVYRDNVKQMDKKFTFPYYMGVMMDIHIPAIKLGKHTTLHEIYCKHKAPELIKITDIEHDSVSRVPNETIERHWVAYSCHVNPPPEEKKSSGKEPKPSRGRKRNTNKNLINTLVDVSRTTTTKKPESAQDPKVLKEILTKGQPNQIVVRYVKNVFIKGLVNAPENNPIVITMTRMFFLGAYQHAQAITPPVFRIRLYTSTTPGGLYNMLEDAEYNSNQLYYILAEFIVAATRHNAALMSMLMKNPGHKSYEDMATYNGDKMRTTYIPFSVELFEPPKVPKKQRVPSYIRLFWELVRHLEIKHKAQPKKIALAIKGIGFTALYKVFQKQPNTFQIYKRLLEEMEMPPADIQLIETALGVGPNELIIKGIKKMVGALSPVGKNRLYLYVHYITRRAMLGYIPIGHTKQIRSVRGDLPEPKLIVCANCFMIRTPCLMDRPEKKGKSKGVELDIENHQLKCSGCRSSDIEAADMRRMYVYGPSMSDTSRSRVYCTCSRCGIMTVYKYVIGQSEFCQSCYKNDMAALLTVRKCICGQRLDEKSKHTTINATNSNGQISIYGVCAVHRFITNACRRSDIQPIAFYRKLIRLNERKRKRDH